MNRKRKKRSLFAAAVFCMAVLFLTDLKAGAEELIHIESNKKYKGMHTSFAEGYSPVIKKNIMYLVVPFRTKAKILNGLQVGVSFEREENSPFYYRNYQKKVNLSRGGVYLYRCRIKLKKNRMNGQYPLYLEVLAETGEETVRQQFTIYIEITDGRAAFQNENYPPEDGLPESVPKEQEGENNEEKEEVSHQPRMMVETNSLQKTPVLAGESFFWTLTAKNCSTDQETENLKVTLISENRDLIFEKTAWYFERIAAGGTMDLSQNIAVEKKAAAEAVPVQFQFDYEDKKGNAYSSAETVVFSIKQTQRAELVNFSMPESFFESDIKPVAFQVQNTGLSVIYNAKVRIEAKGLFSKEAFLGNMEAGDSKDGELEIFAGTLNMDAQGEITDENAEKYGSVSGRVIFTYENEQGETTEQEQAFLTAIQKPEIVELKIEKEEQKTNQWWITVLAMAFLLLMLVIAGLLLRLNYYRRMRRETYEKT